MKFRNFIFIVISIFGFSNICLYSQNKNVAKESVNIKDFGAKGDGITDDTQAFQKAADTRKPILVQNTGKQYLISERIRLYNSITGIGNPVIKMTGKVNEFVKPKNYKYGKYSIFHVGNYQSNLPLIIEGLTLDGSWNSKNKGSEFEAGIYIASSKNVIVRNNIIKNTLGDAILVYWFNSSYEEHVKNYCENILIEKNVLINPYRCNVAVISGKDITIKNNKIEKYNDFVPSIDLEMDVWDKDGQLMKNINVTENNISSLKTKYAISVLGVRNGVDNITINKNIIVGNEENGGYGINLEASYGPIKNVIVSDNHIDSDTFVRVSGTEKNYNIVIAANQTNTKGNNNRAVLHGNYIEGMKIYDNISTVSQIYYSNIILGQDVKDVQINSNSLKSLKWSSLYFVEDITNLSVFNNTLESEDIPVTFESKIDNAVKNASFSSNHVIGKHKNKNLVTTNKKIINLKVE
ncbi:glycosyl hydrolase family 28-related protein [Chryseobacterium sp.]|uniref:right-handed parallel beta-helix repeat-containing protein n=1 Tax=Chryseobacterium sp. TaxID=1871047 RepID=UPI0024E1CC30|nr:glycosyl hydrolase family 28-related protein [Chryseobacterium sp.]